MRGIKFMKKVVSLMKVFLYNNPKKFLHKNLKKLAVFTLIVFFTFLSASVISAAFSIGNTSHSISKTYGPSFNISGWINISFSNEPTSSLFSDSFGNSASLEKLLEKNPFPSYSETCIPLNCKKDYSATNPQTTKTFDMGAGSSKIVGLKFTGNVSSVNSINFDVQSNATASCLSQLKIDLFNNGTTDFQNNKNELAGLACGAANYGCFNSSLTSGVYILNGPYCQRINLSESPSIRVGAWVRKNSGNLNIKMEIYEIRSGNSKGSCDLPAVTSEGEYYCDINYPVLQPAEHYVCIYPTTGTGDYRIKGSSERSCGFPGPPGGIQGEVASYQIFAQGKQFASFGTVNVYNNLPDGETFSAMVFDYLRQKYGLRGGVFECGTSGCIVPINLTSNAAQTVSLKNLKANYHPTAGDFEENNFYDLTETAPKVSSNFQKLYLDKAGFVVPKDLGNYTFSLEFNNNEILSEKIEIKNVPIIKSLSPLSTASAYPTEFTLNVASPSNVSIAGYNWNFGDNTQPITTSINKSVHIYSATGIYQLTVGVTDSRGFSSSRIFEINVSSPKNLINATLYNMNRNLENVKAGIQALQPFYRTGLNNVLKIQNMTNELGNLTIRYNNPTNNESDYNAILTTLLKIKIPTGVFKTEQAPSFLFLSEKDSVDMDVIKSIGGGNYSSSKTEDYKNAVVSWQIENVDLFLNYNEFSGGYDSDIDLIIKTFEIRASPKNSSINYNYYLIVPELDNMDFDRNVNRSLGFVYVNLKDNPEFRFYTTEDLNFTELPLFVSPPISRLSLTGGEPLPPEKSKTFIVVLVFLILIVVMGIVYFIIQRWYKKKYEKYLFPNKNDLYNLAIYVNNAKKRGLSNSEIREHLKKAKWNSEQIRYVMRKYEGKNTGMFEIPATNWAKKIKEDERKGHGHGPEGSSGVRRF